jgi:DNA-binding MurR/RpiR family transcriptional regulator
MKFEGSNSLNEAWIKMIDAMVENTPEEVKNNIEIIAQFRRVFFAGAGAAFSLIERGHRENLGRDIFSFFEDEDNASEQ